MSDPILRQLEREIESALYPEGMHLNDGRARFSISHVQRAFTLAEKCAAQSALTKEMAEALEAMLSALNNEASAAMAAEVASSNFDNPEPYIANYEKAVIASSEASTKANAALAKYRSQTCTPT